MSDDEEPVCGSVVMLKQVVAVMVEPSPGVGVLAKKSPGRVRVRSAGFIPGPGPGKGPGFFLQKLPKKGDGFQQSVKL